MLINLQLQSFSGGWGGAAGGKVCKYLYDRDMELTVKW